MSSIYEHNSWNSFITSKYWANAIVETNGRRSAKVINYQSAESTNWKVPPIIDGIFLSSGNREIFSTFVAFCTLHDMKEVSEEIAKKYKLGNARTSFMKEERYKHSEHDLEMFEKIKEFKVSKYYVFNLKHLCWGIAGSKLGNTLQSEKIKKPGEYDLAIKAAELLKWYLKI